MRLKFGDEFNFLGYCRSIAKGYSSNSFHASVVLSLHGDSPSRCRDKLRRLLKNKKISQEEHDSKVESIKIIKEMYTNGVGTHVIRTDIPGHYNKIVGSPGCHMRINHTGHADQQVV
jgi:hypothetical protein